VSRDAGPVPLGELERLRPTAPQAPAFEVMGIVNVTPDSFSDGGRFIERSAAVDHALALVSEGASILDIGGESTRPGASPVSEADELARVLPVIEHLAATLDGSAGAPRGQAVWGGGGVRASRGIRISVDTAKYAVAEAALGAGATLINDVTAFRAAPEMAALAAATGAEVCLVHMLGEPRTMQAHPVYGDVVSEVKAFLEARLAFVVAEGVAEDRVMLDPGIGFGKTVAHNLALLARVDELVALGRPVVIGTSRKSFLGALTGNPDPAARLAATLATNVMAFERGAQIFRVHDVAPVHDALLVASATMTA
jgi:dihydropteroate synthase